MPNVAQIQPESYLDKRWGHVPFLALLLGFGCLLTLHVYVYRYDLEVDEFVQFENARHYLTTGEFPDISTDKHFFRGQPRGVVYAWMVLGSMALFGVNEVAARLPSIAGALLCMLAVYVAVYRALLLKIPALLAALVFPLSAFFVPFSLYCRMYTLIVFFHFLFLVFLYHGLERARGHALGPWWIQKWPGLGRSRAGRFLERLEGLLIKERIHLGYLVLAGIVFVLNLNQRTDLIIVPIGLLFCALPLCFANSLLVAARRANYLPAHMAEWPLSRRFYLKYPVLTLLSFSAIALLYVEVGGKPVIMALPMNVFQQLPVYAREYVDLTFSQRNSLGLSLFFIPSYAGLIAILLVAGALGFALLSDTWRGFGFFLLAIYVFSILLTYFGWRQVPIRYVLHFYAMHAPLLGVGAYALFRGMLRLSHWLSRFLPLQAIVLFLGPLLLLVAIGFDLPGNVVRSYPVFFLHSPYPPSGRLLAYDRIFSRMQPGDFFLHYMWTSDFYIEKARAKYRIGKDQFTHITIPKNLEFAPADLAALATQHPRGWIIWPINREGIHIRRELTSFCEEYMMHHAVPGAEGVWRLYSWDETQAAALAEYAVNAGTESPSHHQEDARTFQAKPLQHLSEGLDP